MSDVVEVIVTGPPDFMPGLVEALVSERLIACGQLTNIESTYRWQGTIEQAAEVRAALHTTSELAESVVHRARESHPYEVPCILVIPTIAGQPDYLAWVQHETRAGPTK